MTPIAYAVTRIKREIPPQILNKFFTPRHTHQLRRDAFMPGNIDQLIIEKVINGIVRPDCDIAGASEITISLAGLPPEMIERDKYLLHIPKHLTNGREITSALALVYYGMNNVNFNGQLQGYGIDAMSGSNMKTRCSNSNGLQTVQALGKTMQPMMATESTNVEVIDGQTILVSDLVYPTMNSYLRCIVSTDREFTNLNQSAWFAFGKLCVYACKMYIYNQHIIDIDTAELHGGLELGRFKEIIESYSEAYDLYQEYYNDKWRKIQFMGDEVRHTRFLKSLIGRYK